MCAALRTITGARVTEPLPEPAKPQPPANKIHWRAYAAAGAVLATVVAFTNGLDVIVNKLPAVVGRLTGIVWKPPAQAPITLTIAKDSTKPSPGHSQMAIEGIGDVMGGGADVRLVMQTPDAGKVVQVVKLVARVKRLDPKVLIAFNDPVDPLAQPGFGAARPDTFQVNIKGETDGSVSYVRDAANADSANFPDLLPANPALVYQFGGADKPQQTLDLKLRLQTAGIYEVRFVATTVSEGRENVVESEPVRIGRK